VQVKFSRFVSVLYCHYPLHYFFSPWHSLKLSAILFVALGIPVVATNIDVFNESQNNGAGIVLVDRNPNSFVSAIKDILETPGLSEELIEKDRKYCAKYSMFNFSDLIIDS